MRYLRNISSRARRSFTLSRLRLFALLPPLVLALGLGVGRAQLPAVNPLVVPPLPPSPPAQLPAPVTTAVAPGTYSDTSFTRRIFDTGRAHVLLQLFRTGHPDSLDGTGDVGELFQRCAKRKWRLYQLRRRQASILWSRGRDRRR